MLINKKIIVAAAMVSALGISSCRKFLNVNDNPNVSSTATVKTLLPAAQLYVASTVGVDLQINGSIWGEYWTQSPNASQYRSLEQYAPGQDYFSTPWTNLYTAAENFYQLYKLADSQHKKQYKAIALVMRAYTFQLITDAWGDAPYRQALKGQAADSGIINPKYDSQRVIYNGILANLDSALKYINPNDPNTPGADDLIYGGNMTRWQKFAFTLKLRILMRMSNIDPVKAQSGVAALYATPGFKLIGDGDDAKVAFGFSTANKSPLYAEASSTTLAGVQNLVGSSTCIDSMNADGDYRTYIFYEPLANGSFAGIAQGNYSTAALSTTYSLPSVYVAGDANNSASGNAPVNLLTSYESYFLQAEAVARGWVAGNDSALFVQAIHSSFTYYSSAFADQNLLWADTTGGFILPDGVSILSAPIYLTADFAFYSYMNGDTAYVTPSGTPAPAYWSTYSRSWSLTEKIRHIITQKWFSMCGNQGFEAWNEKRRTGYPDFFVVSKNTIIGPNYPKRFLYPTSESTRNVNFPGLKPLTSKPWWDLF